MSDNVIPIRDPEPVESSVLADELRALAVEHPGWEYSVTIAEVGPVRYHAKRPGLHLIGFSKAGLSEQLRAAEMREQAGH